MVHASLFSGIGGPEVAAAMLGWENAFHCEINPFGRTVLEYWFPESISYYDITKTSFKEWRGRIDVLTGGFPCQPFSYAGKRGGAEDLRYLWPEMLRAIDEIRPTWVVGENVAGLATMVEGGVFVDLGGEATLFEEGDNLHRYELEQTFTIERICQDLERAGYSVQPMLIPAAAVGAPHRRDRIFILAYLDAPDTEDVFRDGGCDKHEGKSGGKSFSEFGNGGRQDVASHSHLQRCDKSIDAQKSRISQRFNRKADFEWKYGNLHPEKRWATFPTVPPVHRGNDGLPFSLDNLTIPQTRWRTESLKAYGNAIVPQVMYRIFQMINEL